MTLTLDEAKIIVRVWGEYLEYCQDKLLALFVGGIPASFLPYPLEKMEAALNMAAKHYHDLGDHESSNLIRSSIGPLMFYRQDDEALQTVAATFGNPDMRKLSLENLKNAHERWMMLHSRS